MTSQPELHTGCLISCTFPHYINGSQRCVAYCLSTITALVTDIRVLGLSQIIYQLPVHITCRRFEALSIRICEGFGVALPMGKATQWANAQPHEGEPQPLLQLLPPRKHGAILLRYVHVPSVYMYFIRSRPRARPWSTKAIMVADQPLVCTCCLWKASFVVYRTLTIECST